ASTVHTSILAGIRDNTTIEEAVLVGPGTRMVMVDNAGIGGVSDVEIVWSFPDVDCSVATLTGVISPGGAGGPALGGGTLLVDDGAFGGNPAHADVSNTDAIFMISTGAGDGTCAFDTFTTTGFVTVSTVGV
ncbi:MAG: hypothetical protein ACRD32_01440, partial [Nitrososphaerales archaeon]